MMNKPSAVRSLDEILLANNIKNNTDSDQEGESFDSEPKDEFIRGLFETLLLGTRASNAIPSAADGDSHDNQKILTNDYSYHTIFPEFKSKAKSCGNSVLEIIQIFLKHVQPDGEFSITDGAEATDPEAFEGIADVVELLLEDVEGYLDEASGGGSQKQLTLMRGQLKAIASAARSTGSKYAAMVANVADVAKPQEAFMHEIDNSRTGAFVPKLKEKPNAVVPLDLNPVLHDPEDPNADEYSAYYGMKYPHPYEHEIHSFYYQEWQLQPPDKDKVTMPCSVEEQKYIWVDSEAGIESLLQHLLGMEDDSNQPVQEVAIDLEHHSFRSFQGLTCLMQLSTRERDYIVDTLAVRHFMHRLLVVFSDRNVVKVLHGADSDVMWLQRDFGLYLVNMFDTCQAARALQFPSFSLAHLLKKYIGLTVDKKHQLSDWRVRPLPEDMLRYAQLDTHYLLYVYDRLRQDLCEGAGGDMAVRGVLDASREVCLRQYEKEPFRQDGYLFLVKRQGGPDAVTEVQKRVLEALWDWRDRVARERDESLGYIVAGQVMLRVSQHLPQNVDQLGQCGNPLPPVVAEEAAEILQIVRDAIKGKVHRRDSLPGPSIKPPRPTTFRAISNGNKNGSPFNYSSSIAQAQLLGASRGSPSPVTLGSPVPNTEELYRMAGWLTPSHEGPLEAAGLAALADDNQSHKSIKGGHSLDLGTMEEEGLDEHEMIERIREEIAKEPLLCLTADSFYVEGEEGQGPDRQNPGASGQRDVESMDQTETKLQEDEDQIPQSMAEIYKISNRNRKKNKEKKKMRESQVAPGEKEFNEQDMNGTDESDISKYFEGRKKSKNEHGKDSLAETVDYMESIGWVKPEDRESVLLSHLQETNSSVPHSTTGSVGSAGSDHEGHGYGRRSRGNSPGRRGGKVQGSYAKQHGRGNSPGRRQSGKEDRFNDRSDRGGGYREQQQHSAGPQEGTSKGFRGYDYNSTAPVVGAFGAPFHQNTKAGGATAAPFNPYLAQGGKLSQGQQQGFAGSTKAQSSSGWRPRPDMKERGKSMTYSSTQQKRGQK